MTRYGYPAVGDLFRPHMTLTRLKEHNPKVFEPLPQDVDAFSGIFDRLGLFEIGENGTYIRKIAEFPLGC